MRTILYVGQTVTFEQYFAAGSIDVTVKLKNNGLMVFSKPTLSGEAGFVSATVAKKCYKAPTSIDDGMTIVDLQDLGELCYEEVDTMFETTLYRQIESNISKETHDIIDAYEATMDDWVQDYGLTLDWGEYNFLKPSDNWEDDDWYND